MAVAGADLDRVGEEPDLGFVVEVGDSRQDLHPVRYAIKHRDVIDDVLKYFGADDYVEVEGSDQLGSAGVANLKALPRQVLLGKLTRGGAEVEPNVTAGDGTVDQHVGELGGSTTDLEDVGARLDSFADCLPDRQVPGRGVVHGVLVHGSAVSLVVPAGRRTASPDQFLSADLVQRLPDLVERPANLVDLTGRELAGDDRACQVDCVSSHFRMGTTGAC